MALSSRVVERPLYFASARTADSSIQCSAPRQLPEPAASHRFGFFLIPMMDVQRPPHSLHLRGNSKQKIIRTPASESRPAVSELVSRERVHAPEKPSLFL